MATGNGEGSLYAGLLHEVQELRSELHAHVESTAALFEAYLRETRERFAGMDQNLARMTRMITALADQRDDHEARIRRLEGR